MKKFKIIYVKNDFIFRKAKSCRTYIITYIMLIDRRQRFLVLVITTGTDTGAGGVTGVTGVIGVRGVKGVSAIWAEEGGLSYQM